MKKRILFVAPPETLARLCWPAMKRLHNGNIWCTSNTGIDLARRSVKTLREETGERFELIVLDGRVKTNQPFVNEIHADQLAELTLVIVPQNGFHDRPPKHFITAQEDLVRKVMEILQIRNTDDEDLGGYVVK